MMLDLYYSAEDADSFPEEGAAEKKEGAFCVWKKTEIEELLGGEQISNKVSWETCHNFIFEDS